MKTIGLIILIALWVPLLVGCNLPSLAGSPGTEGENLSGETIDDSTQELPPESGSLVTGEQALTGGFDCQKNAPFQLVALHKYRIEVDEATFQVYTFSVIDLAVDRGGNVSGTASGSAWDIELISEECRGKAVPAYTANVTGTCKQGVMNLQITEMFDNGGSYGMTMACDDSDPYTFDMPGAPMNHEVKLPLTSTSGMPTVKIWWMKPTGKGFKSWTLYPEGEVPIVPLDIPEF